MALQLDDIVRAKAKEKQLSTLKQNTDLELAPKRSEPIHTDKELAKTAGGAFIQKSDKPGFRCAYGKNFKTFIRILMNVCTFPLRMWEVVFPVLRIPHFGITCMYAEETVLIFVYQNSDKQILAFPQMGVNLMYPQIH